MVYKLLSIITVLIFLPLSHAVAQEVDPTRPLFGESQASSNKVTQAIELQSIINNGQQLTVVINGRLLKVGDKIEQYQLKKINKNSVVLSSTDKHLELSLFSPIVAKSQ